MKRVGKMQESHRKYCITSFFFTASKSSQGRVHTMCTYIYDQDNTHRYKQQRVLQVFINHINVKLVL
jgi:hypothetical protein